MTLARCPYCGTDPEGELDACLRRMHDCRNCRVDIACRGEWTGYGWRAAQRLKERFGMEALLKADAALARNGTPTRRATKGGRP
jgi:hypothetical protein